MNLRKLLSSGRPVLMEGALGERLKTEYRLTPDANVALARFVYQVRGMDALSKLWNEYYQIAADHGLPFLATTPTRRAGRDFVLASAWSSDIIADNVKLLRHCLQERPGAPRFLGGLMGCRGDAYTGEGALTESEARKYHSWQAELFRKSDVDFLFAGIMPTLPEAKGMAQAMAATGLPYIISFTIRKDGRLIDGTTIHDAIVSIDRGFYQKPLCYMTNCVHPAIVFEALSQPFNRTDVVRERFFGVQGNTSPLSYEELDHALPGADLKSSAPKRFAEDMLRLRKECGLQIFGGCCGTDGRYLEETAKRIAETDPEKTKK